MRVVIGEDEALLRDGLTLVLQREGIDVVACAADADEVVAASARTRPDLVLTDLRMARTRTDDGLRAAQRIRAEQPGTAVVVLSHHVNGQYAAELLGERATAVGYLLKQRIADTAGFCRDLRRVAEGGVALDPEVITAMLARRDDAVEQLSTRRRGSSRSSRRAAATRASPGCWASRRSPSSPTPRASTTPSAWRGTSTTTAASSRWSAT